MSKLILVFGAARVSYFTLVPFHPIVSLFALVQYWFYLYRMFVFLSLKGFNAQTDCVINSLKRY